MLRRFLDRIGFTLLLLAGIAALPQAAFAHCDTVDGPVVTAAKLALERGDAAPVLMWVKKEHEPQIREALSRALEVRQQGESARALADQFFFETVVRLHRAGEGAPYTGLRPAGLDVGPAIPLAEAAITTGSAAEVVGFLTGVLEHELTERLEEVCRLAAVQDRGVADARRHVTAVLGYQVYCHHLLQAMRASAHGRPATGEGDG
jgi:hypothetical protein